MAFRTFNSDVLFISVGCETTKKFRSGENLFIITFARSGFGISQDLIRIYVRRAVVAYSPNTRRLNVAILQ